jgi:hypothetical protein
MKYEVIVTVFVKGFLYNPNGNFHAAPYIATELLSAIKVVA